MQVCGTIHEKREKTGMCWSGMAFFAYPFKGQTFHDIETSQLICSANELTCFFVMATSFFKEVFSRFEYFLLQFIDFTTQL